MPEFEGGGRERGGGGDRELCENVNMYIVCGTGRERKRKE